MSSGCSCQTSTSTSTNMTHPLFNGLLMGAGIYVCDLVLRPQFAINDLMSILLFFVEGAVCDVIYSSIHAGKTGKIMDYMSIKKTVLAGATIWITDFLLRPEYFAGMGMEIIKFFLQGVIVLMVLGYGA